MHIQFWWAFFVRTLGPDPLSRSSRSRCSLERQRMNSLRILSNCRSLMGLASASPIAASAPRIDLAPGLFFAAGDVHAPREGSEQTARQYGNRLVECVVDSAPERAGCATTRSACGCP